MKVFRSRESGVGFNHPSTHKYPRLDTDYKPTTVTAHFCDDPRQEFVVGFFEMIGRSLRSYCVLTANEYTSFTDYRRYLIVGHLFMLAEARESNVRD